MPHEQSDVSRGCVDELDRRRYRVSVQLGSLPFLSLPVTAGRRGLVARLEWPMLEQCAPRATREALMW